MLYISFTHLLLCQVDHTKAEKAILQSIQHPFLMCLRYSFQTSDQLYLVMDFVNGGEMFTHLAKEGTFSNERARFYAAEVVLGLEYLHSKGIIYRDLKPENLLLDCEGKSMSLPKLMYSSSDFPNRAYKDN